MAAETSTSPGALQRVTEWPEVESLTPGSRVRFDYAVAPLASGAWVTVPVQILAGARAHPRVVAVAGIHGDEAEGMLALLDFWQACDLDDLDGTVVLVPVANPMAFAAHARRSPVDGLDLNRTFPGRPDGTISERLAYRLLHDVVAGADFLFTLHSWFATGSGVPYVEYPAGTTPLAVRSREAGIAAGFRRLRASGWPEGALVPAANALGVPGLEAEIGGHGMSSAANRAAYVDHLRRLLQHLGALRGAPPANLDPEFYGRGHLMAPASGLLRLIVRPGDLVKPDELLATICDLHGASVAEIRSPHGGLVAGVREFVSVNAGEHVIALFPRLDDPAG
jgi:predicted deacylase